MTATKNIIFLDDLLDTDQKLLFYKPPYDKWKLGWLGRNPHNNEIQLYTNKTAEIYDDPMMFTGNSVPITNEMLKWHAIDFSMVCSMAGDKFLPGDDAAHANMFDRRHRLIYDTTKQCHVHNNWNDSYKLTHQHTVCLIPLITKTLKTLHRLDEEGKLVYPEYPK